VHVADGALDILAVNADRGVFHEVLVVCLGNVCRSPIAASILQWQLGDRACVQSAGIAAVEGLPIDPTAEAVLAGHGLDASRHRSRRITQGLLQAAGIVLVMERRQLAALCATAPEATGKTFLLDKWVASRDIPDPYRQPRSVFERVYQMIEQGTSAWLPYLQ
jgi:protein-tyrosine phosphatase